MATRTPVATESFTASDGVDLGGTGVTPWTQLNSVQSLMRVLSNQVRASHVNPAAARHTGTYTDDQYAVMTLAGTFSANASMYVGVIARASADTGANRDFYGYQVKGDGNKTSTLHKVVNGSNTDLGTEVDEDWAPGDTIEIECEGSTIRGFRNGVLTIEVTDTALTTGKPGCQGQSPSTLTGDDWIGGNLTASTPPKMGRRIYSMP